jgi:hypothetical protein
MDSTELCGQDEDVDMAGSDVYAGALAIWQAVRNGTISDVEKAIYDVSGVGKYPSGYVNMPVGDQWSALYVAVTLNDAAKVRLLLENGADLFQDDWDELEEACGNTHSHVLDIIREAQDDWNYQSKHCGEDRIYDGI